MLIEGEYWQIVEDRLKWKYSARHPVGNFKLRATLFKLCKRQQYGSFQCKSAVLYKAYIEVKSFTLKLKHITNLQQSSHVL